MINKTLIALLTGTAMMITQTALADRDDMPNNVVKISAVVQNIQEKGYRDVREVEFDDGIYKAEAMNAEGRKVNLYIDPQKNEIKKVKTGEKINAKGASAKLPILDAIKKVEAAGYHDVYEIDFEHDQYEVKAIDNEGKKAKLIVNTNTGDVSKKWFD